MVKFLCRVEYNVSFLAMCNHIECDSVLFFKIWFLKIPSRKILEAIPLYMWRDVMQLASRNIIILQPPTSNQILQLQLLIEHGSYVQFYSHS